MLTIGLTGGIGSGKSTVARLLAEHGWKVVDADQIAREVVEPDRPALAELAEEFGADIIDAAGGLDRAELARRAFSSAARTDRLNAITHPYIRAETKRQFAAAEKAGEKAVIYDMPLLVELGLNASMDLVVVVDVAADERVRRLVAARGMDEDDARARIAAQLRDDEWLAAADVVLDNNGSPEELASQVQRLESRIESLVQ
ncbi:dephospho-CoA kinase [Corynebacterium atypicum]|uniref:Dephospho-CoA kinase n=1 Tax=Corynebacterium atypicum TaxID=191610 RepID=A0ABM5QNA5_9CORY|nr:dephospho-CoA kinase [Corynebacterium atypicum]AIG64218.1 dephospho-CoA kinase [Corynebacterium atypicum]